MGSVLTVPCRVCDDLDEGDPSRGMLCPGCYQDMLAVAGLAGWPVDTPECRRFVIKLDMGGPIPAHNPALGPCWLWLKATTTRNYGAFKLGKRTVYAHLLAYEWTHGAPIPDGLVHDHLCHDPEVCYAGDQCPHRPCCNPDHGAAVTHRENVLRSNSPPALNRRKANCGTCGRPLSGKNLYVAPGGSQRQCRYCKGVQHRIDEANRPPRHRGPDRTAGPGQLTLT